MGLLFLFSTTETRGAEGPTNDLPALTPQEQADQQAQEAAELQIKLVNQRKATIKWKSKADRWAHIRRTHSVHRPLSPATSLSYEKYRTTRWHKEANTQRRLTQAYLRHLRAVDREWAYQDRHIHRAIRAAAKKYGVSYSWLHACAHSEGLRDGGEPWVMNTSGSGAGGWFQFMESTLYGNVKHVDIPRRYKRWNSKVGQAYTAAYMFKIGQSGQWTGPGCN